MNHYRRRIRCSGEDPSNTLNESGFAKDAVKALKGRPIHAFHTKAAGNGHVPDIIKITEHVTLAENRVGKETIVVKDVLHDLGAFWMPSDLQAMAVRRSRRLDMADCGQDEEASRFAVSEQGNNNFRFKRPAIYYQPADRWRNG